jgi:hypothetical protein
MAGSVCSPGSAAFSVINESAKSRRKFLVELHIRWLYSVDCQLEVCDSYFRNVKTLLIIMKVNYQQIPSETMDIVINS